MPYICLFSVAHSAQSVFATQKLGNFSSDFWPHRRRRLASPSPSVSAMAQTSLPPVAERPSGGFEFRWKWQRYRSAFVFFSSAHLNVLFPDMVSILEDTSTLRFAMIKKTQVIKLQNHDYPMFAASGKYLKNPKYPMYNWFLLIVAASLFALIFVTSAFIESIFSLLHRWIVWVPSFDGKTALFCMAALWPPKNWSNKRSAFTISIGQYAHGCTGLCS